MNDKIKVKTMLRQMFILNFAKQYDFNILTTAIELTLQHVDEIKILDYIDLQTQVEYLYDDLRLQLMYNIEKVINVIMKENNTDLIQ